MFGDSRGVHHKLPPTAPRSNQPVLQAPMEWVDWLYFLISLRSVGLVFCWAGRKKHGSKQQISWEHTVFFIFSGL